MLNVLLIVFFGSIAFGLVRPNRGESSFLCRLDTDFIRGIAILMIMLAHIAVQLGENTKLIGGGYTYRVVSSWGGVGVAIFFFLSGYGNLFSILKLFATEKQIKGRATWLWSRIRKLIFVFVLCFVPVCIITEFSLPEMYDFRDYLVNLLTLRIPGTSTWYLKIQILMYILIWIAAFIGKEKSRFGLVHF